MSTRENLMADFESQMAAAVRVAYPWVETGATRDIPADLKTVDDVSPEATPLTFIDEGEETYPEYENGWTKCRLSLKLTGVVKRQDRLSGPMSTIANNFLAVMQKAAWNYKHPSISVTVLTDGPSAPNAGPGQARPYLDIALVYFINDKEP